MQPVVTGMDQRTLIQEVIDAHGSADRWDDLDFIYFGGYATWNYLVTPFLFLRDGFSFEPLEPLPGMPASWAGVRVSFPMDIPTHCNEQVFWFDDQRHLRRLDYTAEVVGGWARAAHLCDEYKEFNGLTVPTRRRVRPMLVGNRPLPAPVLVAIDVHDVRAIPVSRSGPNAQAW